MIERTRPQEEKQEETIDKSGLEADEQPLGKKRKLIGIAMMVGAICAIGFVLSFAFGDKEPKAEPQKNATEKLKQQNDIARTIKTDKIFRRNFLPEPTNDTATTNGGGGAGGNLGGELGRIQKQWEDKNATPKTEEKPVIPVATQKKAKVIKGLGRTLVIEEGGSGGNMMSKMYSDNSGGANGMSSEDTAYIDQLNKNQERAMNMLENLVGGQIGGGGGAGGNFGGSNSGGGGITGEVFTPTLAEKSKFNPNLLLSKGTYIPCSLQTKVVSEYAGNLLCTVTRDVYSSNGNVLLIEKGSRIYGRFAGGNIDDATTRIFVIWQEIRTPYGINIPVASASTDPLGATGMDGWINHHYFKRFGSAIMLSVFDDALGVIANNLKKINEATGYADDSENTRGTASEIAKTALNKFINLKPTLYKNQGDLVSVIVNRDIDFSAVYRLEIKEKGKK